MTTGIPSPNYRLRNTLGNALARIATGFPPLVPNVERASPASDSVTSRPEPPKPPYRHRKVRFACFCLQPWCSQSGKLEIYFLRHRYSKKCGPHSFGIYGMPHARNVRYWGAQLRQILPNGADMARLSIPLDDPCDVSEHYWCRHKTPLGLSSSSNIRPP